MIKNNILLNDKPSTKKFRTFSKIYTFHGVVKNFDCALNFYKHTLLLFLI